MIARKLMVLCFVLFHSGVALAVDDLEQGFVRPPAAARPLTWWHWLNGSITKEGITADLESMKNAGLGGCYLFNCGGKMPEGEVRFMQPKWLEMMDHTVREAQRLGLKFGVHNCDGFSQSGGPWIKPESSMKELTWTATDVVGPAAFTAQLRQPEMNEEFYRDIAVIAFPLPEGGPLTGATFHGTCPAAELQKLADGKSDTQASFPVPKDEHNIDFVFPDARVVRSLTLRNCAPHRWEEDFPLRLAVSDDGQKFRTVGQFTANWDFHGGSGCTVAFPDTTGRVFRVAFKNPLRMQIGEMELSSAAKTHLAEAKAGLLRSRGHGGETRHHRAYPGPDRNRPLAPSLVVAKDAVRVLTPLMNAAGQLKWDVPAGRWRILRVGFTSNGHYVSPATAEGRGLECDKLDPAMVQFHLTQYVDKLLALAGPAAGSTFAAVEIDSWECGVQNWTAGFENRFRQRNGYDLLPFLPALLEGWIIADADLSERVLWDWRRFLADQFSESYFAVAAKHFREKGVTYVGESTGRQQYLYDIAYLRNSDVAMGEFWIDSGPGQGVRVDNKVASSIAHVSGKPIVASESYTSSPGSARWQNHPFSLKPEGDRAFCAGVNQFVFHTFAHQPYRAVGPGFTFFFWGLNFNRGNTWWEAADAWMSYLTRCNYLLRQGQQVCDVLWFVGEDVPNRIAWRDELKPVLPEGYDFDGCDVTALMAARVQHGRVVLPSGAEYRVLLLPDLPTMRPAVAAKVLELTQAGATVLAPRRPLQSPTLRDRGAGDEAVRESMIALWGNGPTPVDRRVGKGRFFAGLSFAEVFQRLGLTLDFACHSAAKDAEILYVHRRAGGADIYFLSNQQCRFESFEAMFRVGAKAPELWDPASGQIVRPGVFRQGQDGRVAVPMRLEPNGSVFVVFRAAPSSAHAVAIEKGASAGSSSVAPPVPPADLQTAARTFTLAAWVKPDAEIPLPAERKASVALQGQNWAVFPLQGQAQFGDGHAGVGIAAGRNGVVVFEHSARYAPAVITWPAEIKESTHLAVVYRDGVPSLFVNGLEQRTGAKGPHTAHAALSSERVFHGERSGLLLFDRALSAAEIAALAHAKPTTTGEPPAGELQRDSRGVLQARFWKREALDAVLADDQRVHLPAPALPDPLLIGGAWQVAFPPGRGVPAAAKFEKLISWPDHPESGIKYFSGTATYRKELDLPAALFGPNRELYLDLGEVAVIARATLNGQELPTLWKPPFRVRIDNLAHPGVNRLEIRVTNLWPNRMIGDAGLPDDIEWQRASKGAQLPLRWPDWLVQGQPRPSGRIAFCTRKDVYSKQDPLLPSGLLGPVSVRAAECVSLAVGAVGGRPVIQPVLAHIRQGFPQSIKVLKEDRGDVVGLPYPYTSPCVKEGFQQLFYWDTYFINQGLLGVGMPEQARHNTDNLLFLLDKLGLVPNANRLSMANRSQIPFLSQMVRDTYESAHDDAWLKAAVATLKKEHTFWMTKRIAPVGLNRSGNEATEKYLLDFYNYLASVRFKGIAHATKEEKLAFSRQALSEAETWDFTPRFDRRAEDFCAVDLNSNLHVYETNFAWFSRLLNDGQEQDWLARAARRKELIDKLLWNETIGCYTDYDWINRKQGDLVSCAALFPLAAGLASPQQAERVVQKMRAALECAHGLATCEKRTQRFVYQWDYPNAWPPMQWIAIQALDRYGYKQDARRIAEKYVQTVTRNFQKTGDLWEKYNALTGQIDVADEYQMPRMMGWTAGVFVRALQYLDPALLKVEGKR